MVMSLNIVSCTQNPTKHQQCRHPKNMVFDLFYAAEKNKKVI